MKISDLETIPMSSRCLRVLFLLIGHLSVTLIVSGHVSSPRV